MQSASSRIRTRVTVSISYDDNHYTSGTSIHCLYLFLSLSLFYSLVFLFCLFSFSVLFPPTPPSLSLATPLSPISIPLSVCSISLSFYPSHSFSKPISLTSLFFTLSLFHLICLLTKNKIVVVRFSDEKINGEYKLIQDQQTVGSKCDGRRKGNGKRRKGNGKRRKGNGRRRSVIVISCVEMVCSTLVTT